MDLLPHQGDTKIRTGGEWEERARTKEKGGGR